MESETLRTFHIVTLRFIGLPHYLDGSFTYVRNFTTPCIGHLENNDSLSYADVPNATHFIT